MLDYSAVVVNDCAVFHVPTVEGYCFFPGDVDAQFVESRFPVVFRCVLLPRLNEELWGEGDAWGSGWRSLRLCVRGCV